MRSGKGQTTLSGARFLFPRHRMPAVLFLVTAGVLQSARGQPAIDWHSIDGGGGASTGGVYAVSGTIGQPDADSSPMTGGTYAVRGGFWTVIAIQTPGAPVLGITLAGAGQATISWAPDSPGWVLQKGTSLVTPNWSNAPGMPTTPTTVTITPTPTYYRLIKP